MSTKKYPSHCRHLYNPLDLWARDISLILCNNNTRQPKALRTGPFFARKLKILLPITAAAAGLPVELDIMPTGEATGKVFVETIMGTIPSQK